MGSKDRKEKSQLKANGRGAAVKAAESEAFWPMLGQRSTPGAGDVLASERSARADVYAISVVPEDAQLFVSRYPDAIEKVRKLARRLKVDGWFTSDHTHYARIASHRSRAEG